jgi:hypothetical protein
MVSHCLLTDTTGGVGDDGGGGHGKLDGVGVAADSMVGSAVNGATFGGRHWGEGATTFCSSEWGGGGVLLFGLRRRQKKIRATKLKKEN